LAGLSAFSELPALVFEQINRFVVCNSLKAQIGSVPKTDNRMKDLKLRF
jgi:hypothetical protein